jgi:hypothetical protein
MKQLDGTPFFAYLMPESIHPGQEFNWRPSIVEPLNAFATKKADMAKYSKSGD